MSEFQITFRGVLPDEDLRELAEAMHAKVQAQYGKAARCHIAIEHSESGLASDVGLVSARVQLESDSASITAHGQALHPNPVRAVRSAFEQAYLQIRTHQAVTRAANTSGGVLLLFAARKHAAEQTPVRTRRSSSIQRVQGELSAPRASVQSATQASRNAYLSVVSARTRG